MTSSGNEDLIVRSVIDLSHNLGLTAVAEGVESAEALAALENLGCDVAQGFHLSRPLPGPEFERWYEARLAAGDGGAASTALGRAF
jgi:EAL domain-containing protein (putative c-di-GMP-specific phosphodiesterase class I)